MNAQMNQSVHEKKSDVYQKALEEVRNPSLREGDKTFQGINSHKFREFIQEENEDDNSGNNQIQVRLGQKG